MRFGICLPIRIDTEADFCIKLAVRAEDLNFDSVWVSDHTVISSRRVGRFSRVFHDPFVLLSAIASHTERISTGISVLVAPHRNPLMAAKAFATLDEISGGRVVAGVGAGWMEEEFRMLGAEFERRGALTDEFIDVCREVWGSESPEFKGRFCSFSDIAFYPKPVRGAALPIYVGGNGERSMRRAAVRGDGWQPTGISPAQYAERSAPVKQMAGERDLVFSVRNRVSFGERKQSRTLYSFSGSAAGIREQVEEFSEAGVNLILFDPEAPTQEGVLETVERLASDVISGF